jgi:hypothetical protein
LRRRERSRFSASSFTDAIVVLDNMIRLIEAGMSPTRHCSAPGGSGGGRSMRVLRNQENDCDAGGSSNDRQLLEASVGGKELTRFGVDRTQRARCHWAG